MLNKNMKRLLARLPEFCLMDDTFFNTCLGDDTESVEVMLHIILKRKDLKVVKFINQKLVPNLLGRSAIFDLLVEDSEGSLYDIEVQKNKEGAIPKRARFNASMLDYMESKKGTQWKDLPKSCVIMISEHDIFGYGDQLYSIKRTIVSHNNASFDDDSEIIYINGSYKGDDELGKLVHDLWCTNPDDMYYPELAKRVRFFKTNEKGMEKMCEIMQSLIDEDRALAKAEGRAEGRAEGKAEERSMLGRLIEKLQADNNQEAISKIFKDNDFCQQMYAKYNISANQ